MRKINLTAIIVALSLIIGITAAETPVNASADKSTIESSGSNNRASNSACKTLSANESSTAFSRLNSVFLNADNLTSPGYNLNLLGGNYVRTQNPACQNFRQRYNYAMQMGTRAAQYGSLQEIYYWTNIINRLNAEYQIYRYCETAQRPQGNANGNRGGFCDRAAYNSCMADARRMTSPTTGGQTSTGIMMMSQCQQFISGCGY
jgi:hypothetical protein